MSRLMERLKEVAEKKEQLEKARKEVYQLIRGTPDAGSLRVLCMWFAMHMTLDHYRQLEHWLQEDDSDAPVDPA